MIERFSRLFVGSEETHGILNVLEGGAFDHRTAEGPASPEDYEAHLSGKRGLGLVPVRKDGTCFFAALDIDIDTINHQQLYDKIQKHKIPLNVCRSRSGAAHAYAFMKEAVRASKVIAALKHWASVLGYPHVEVFPKQIRVNKSNRGNWINLPYFDHENTTRYGVGPEGALTLDEWLDSIVYWDGKDTVVSSAELPILNNNSNGSTPHSVGAPQLPPCLQNLVDGGIPDGTRNQGMFNFCVFLRKAYPNTWQEMALQYNTTYCKPPLQQGELVRIIKSVDSVKYQYKCNEEPIVSRCKRKECLDLPFGVGHKPWEENDSLDELVLSHLRKVDTDPPQYIVEVNGNDVTLTSEEFFSFAKMKDRIEELLDMVIHPMREDKWRAKRKELHSTQEVIEAPEDASAEGSLMSDVMDFLSRFKASKSADDLLLGQVVEHGDYLCFKVQELQKFLKASRKQFLDNHELFTVLQKHGCIFKSAKVKGKILKIWMYPIKNANVQTEDFGLIDLGTPPEKDPF